MFRHLRGKSLPKPTAFVLIIYHQSDFITQSNCMIFRNLYAPNTCFTHLESEVRHRESRTHFDIFILLIERAATRLQRLN